MTVHPTRAVLLIASTALATVWLAEEGAAQAALKPTLESLITVGVLLGGAAASLGMALLTLAALAEGVLGWRPRAAAALPAPLRRFLTGSVAAAIAVGVALPASADEVYPGWAPLTPTSGPTASAPASSPSPPPVVTIAASPVPQASAPAVPDAAQHPEPQSAGLHGAEVGRLVGATSSRDGTDTFAANAGTGTGTGASKSNSNSNSHYDRVHEVIRGDSLWRIASELLGPDASNAQIAHAWPLIYQANHDTIGADPGLILPGQRLSIPAELTA